MAIQRIRHHFAKPLQIEVLAEKAAMSMSAFRDRVEIAHNIGLMTADEVAEEAVKVVAEGVKTLKIKIGVDVRRDVNVVRRVREAIGPGVALHVDANQGYPGWVQAVDAIQQMMPYGIAYAEQLVDGVDELARVASRLNIPVMADESCWSERDVVRIAATGAAQYLSAYYTKPGGLWKAKRLLTVAGAHRMQGDIHGSGEMGIGNAANLHLARRLRKSRWLEPFLSLPPRKFSALKRPGENTWTTSLSCRSNMRTVSCAFRTDRAWGSRWMRPS